MATDDFTRRRDQLAARLGADALVVSNPLNVTYLSGFLGEASYLVLTPSKAVLVSDARFEEQIRAEVPAGVEVVIRPHTQKLAAAVGGVLASLGAKSTTVEATHLTLAGFEALKLAAPGVGAWKPESGLVEELRATKDDGELAQIRHAVAVAEAAFGHFQKFLAAGATEKELHDALDHLMRGTGARGSAFPPIVAFAERGALPHAPPTGKPLAGSPWLLVDWGADCLYHSDLTRCFRNPHSPGADLAGPSFEEVHAAVNAAHEAAVATLRAGVTGHEVDAAARKVLAGTRLVSAPHLDLNALFTHGLGHGIGLEVHEAPNLRTDSTDVLKPGMVVTIEPGVYIPGWGGIRLEDDYAITEGGAVKLGGLTRGAASID